MAAPYIVTTMWDWAPLNSWNGGKDWEAGQCWGDLPDTPPPSPAIQPAVFAVAQVAARVPSNSSGDKGILGPPPPPCENCTSVKNFWFADTPLNVTVAIPPQVLQTQDCCKLCNAVQDCKAVVYSKNKAWHNTSWANFTSQLYDHCQKRPTSSRLSRRHHVLQTRCQTTGRYSQVQWGVRRCREGDKHCSFGLSNHVVICTTIVSIRQTGAGISRVGEFPGRKGSGWSQHTSGSQARGLNLLALSYPGAETRVVVIIG